MPPKRKYWDTMSSKARSKRKAEPTVDWEDELRAIDKSCAAPTSKKPRTKKIRTLDNVEKRLARYRASCPRNITERMERVFAQRFYLIGRDRQSDALAEVFKVLGSTGNVYSVTIANLPTCDCPDALKGNHCKHLLFVMLKVLHVPSTSPHVYQKALVTSELEEIFAAAPPNPSTHIQNKHLTKAWETATGSPTKATAELADNADTLDCDHGKRRIPKDDDTCPVCYEDIAGEDVSNFVFCETSCGGPVHKECQKNWITAATAKGDRPTCVYCRELWPTIAGGGTATANPNAPAEYSGRYLNLAATVGIDRRRDTSSYYHGPRAGNQALEREWRTGTHKSDTMSIIQTVKGDFSRYWTVVKVDCSRLCYLLCLKAT